MAKQVNVGAIAKRAKLIRNKQKQEWLDFIHSKKKKTQAQVKKFAADYRKKYGATPQKRWKNALKTAAKHNKDTQKSLRLR